MGTRLPPRDVRHVAEDVLDAHPDTRTVTLLLGGAGVPGRLALLPGVALTARDLKGLLVLGNGIDAVGGELGIVVT